MQLSCDPKHKAAYLRLQERTAEAETIRISDSVNIDLAPDGTVCGIELFNANEQLHGGNEGKLVVINEAQGDRQEVVFGRERGDQVCCDMNCDMTLPKYRELWRSAQCYRDL